MRPCFSGPWKSCTLRAARWYAHSGRGGDYEHYDYPEGCVVIDNPPFSIYAKVVRFYLSRGIHFLLFAPGLTQLVLGADVCYLCTFNDVIYQNGALVRTSFTTNMVPSVRLWTAPDLRLAVQEAADRFAARNRRKLNGSKKPVGKKRYRWPDHFISTATVGKIAVRGVDYRIPSDACTYIRKAGDIELFGSALLLSQEAAADRAAADRAAADRDAADRDASMEYIQIEVDPYTPKATNI